MSRSFDQYFMKKSSYAKDNFDVYGFHSNKYMSADQSMASRYHNQIAKAIAKQPVFPKLILVVPDEDFIKHLSEAKKGFSEGCGRLLNDIMRQHNRYISSQKEDYLPAKAKKQHYPHIVWIEAPLHKNF